MNTVKETRDEIEFEVVIDEDAPKQSGYITTDYITLDNGIIKKGIYFYGSVASLRWWEAEQERCRHRRAELHRKLWYPKTTD